MRKRLLLLASLIVSSAWAQDAVAVRFAQHDFAAVGIVPGQTLRVTVLNTARRAVSDRAPAIACRVEVRFYDQGGFLLKEEALDNLTPGTAKWVDYSPQATILIHPPPRILVAAAVAVRTERTGGLVAGVVAATSCTIAPTLEIFDLSTSKTTVAFAGPALTPLLPAGRRAAPAERLVE